MKILKRSRNKTSVKHYLSERYNTVTKSHVYHDLQDRTIYRLQTVSLSQQETPITEMKAALHTFGILLLAQPLRI